jgi:cytoskeletal protein CcmA (bactofilin family)
MSNFGTIYIKPPIYLVDGVVKEKTILDIGYQIEVAFESTGNLIGNIHGIGLETIPSSKYINSLATSIGSMLRVSPEEPFGKIFTGYTQSFSNNLTDKNFLLDLVVGPLDSFTVNAADVITWNRVSNLESLQSEGDYFINGRVLTFHTVPTGSFDAVYDGKYVEFSSVSSGYMPNVFPNPILIANEDIPRPFLSNRPSGRILVHIQTLSNKNYKDKTFGAEQELTLHPVLQPYISASGSIECPDEYISAWVLENGTYRKIDTKGIYILSNTKFEIDTDEPINLSTDTIVMSISNVSISDMVHDLFNLISTHSHDQDSITPPVSHRTLFDLIPQSGKTDVIYGGSNIPGNDHPQYLNREGYKPGDTGTYNNAMLGDLLISSINSTSLFNNVANDSNKIFFGSTTQGVALKYLAAQTGLELYSPQNGLVVNYNSASPASFAIYINDLHKIKDYSVAGYDTNPINIMQISTINDLIVFGADGFSDVADLSTGHHVLAKRFLANEVIARESLIVDDLGTFEIGGLVFTDEGGDVRVTSLSNKLLVDAESVLAAFSGNYTVDANSQINFGDNTSKLYSDGTQARFLSALPFALEATGRTTGISIADTGSTDNWFNLYTATVNGTAATAIDHSSYIETKDGATYFIKSTQEDQVVDGVTFVWNTIQNLQEWPRAPIHAGESSMISLDLNVSNILQRKGLAFKDGSSVFGNIYVTGGGTECPAGWMVVESQNGVVFVNKQTDAIDCQTMSYAEVTTGDLQSFGSIVAANDLAAGGSLRVVDEITGRQITIQENATIDGALRVLGSSRLEGAITINDVATFSNDIIVKGGGSVQGSLQAGGLNVGGVATFNDISKFNNNVEFFSNVNITGSLFLTDVINASNGITTSSITSEDLTATSITAYETIQADGGINSAGNIAVTGSVTITSNLNVDSNAVIENNLTVGSLNVNGDAKVSTDLSVQRDTVLRGNLNLISTDKTMSVAGNASFNGPSVSINSSLQLSGPVTSSSSFTATSHVNFESSLLVAGIVDMTSNLNVGSKVTAESLEITDTAVFGNITANSNVNAVNLFVDEDAQVSGIIVADKDISAQEGFRAGFGSNSQLHNTIIGGSLTQENSSETIGFAGKLEVRNDALITGDSVLNGEVNIGSSSGTNRTTIEGNTIRARGDDSRVITATLNVDEVTGGQPDVFSSDGEASKVADKDFITFAHSYFRNHAVMGGNAYVEGTLYVNEIKDSQNPNSGFIYRYKSEVSILCLIV